MSTVVNTAAITKRMVTLGWQNLGTAEVLDGLAKANITAPQLIAYMDALIAAPDGFNDATITSCPAAAAARITAFVGSKGLVAV
jgi:hypothetical protein